MRIGNVEGWGEGVLGSKVLASKHDDLSSDPWDPTLLALRRHAQEHSRVS